MSNIQKNLVKAKGQLKETFRVTTTRPVAILMIVIGIAVFGWFSYEQLPLNLMPEISYPSLTVRTEYPGAAPEDVEDKVSRRIEAQLAVVDNLVNYYSISKSNLSDVVLEFKWNADMNRATADVREKLDQVFLPEEVEKPIILRYDPTLDPIIRIAFFAKLNPDGLPEDEVARNLREYAEYEIRQKLEAVEGVAAVRVRGGLEPELLIEMDKNKLQAKNITSEEVITAVRIGNINVAGGNLREGETEYQVRVLNEYQDLETIDNLIIARRGGAEIRLAEVASVRWHHKEREIYTRVDGEASVELQIFKEADANIVAVSERIRTRVYGTAGEQEIAERFKKELEARQRGETEEAEPTPQEGGGGRGGPGQFRQEQEPDFLEYEVDKRNWGFRTLTDQSIFIKNSIDEVKNNALLGGILAIIVLFLFLRSVKSTILIGLTIPISIVATFAPMNLFGVSLNIMSLGGLALGIGMLVDSAIVVLESIFRCKEEGDTLVDSVIRGTGEVGGAVIASTLTTIAVFFPIVFVEGVAGQIFGDLSLTVVFSLLASLLAALFFIPMLASRRIAVDNVKGAMSVGEYNFPSAQKVKTKVTDTLSEAEGIFPKILAGIKVVPLALFHSIIAIPGILYELFFKRGNSLELVKNRFSGYWKKDKGLLGNIVAKIILFIPYYILFALVFVVDLLLDLLGRPFNSAVLTGDRLKIFWRKKRGKIAKTLMILTVIPYHLYIFTIFIFHFIFEVVGKLIVLTFLVLFKAIRFLIVVVFGTVGIILSPILWFFAKLIDLITRGYPYAVRWALNNKIAVIIIVLLLTAHAGSLVLGLKAELIPEIHQGEFNIRIKAPVGTDIEQTNELTRLVEQNVREVLSSGDGSVREYETIATVVGAEKASNTRSDEGENTSVITVRLAETEQIAGKEDEAISRIRERINQIPGINSTTFDRPVLFSFKTPVEVEISGPDREFLKNYSNEAVRAMESIDGIIDVKNSIQPGNPELNVEFYRDKLKLYNLDIRAVSQKIRDLVDGNIATQYRRGDRQYDVRVRLQRSDIEDRAALQNLVIHKTQDTTIKVSDVGYVVTKEGPNEIRRIDQERTALITANIEDIDLKTATDLIARELNLLRSNWQSDYDYEITGQTEEMKTSSESLQWAMALAIFLVYIVMASQFESLLQPFIIIFTIPLALIGVVYLLEFSATPVSVVVFIGTIMLAGIVVNNAIVLVDYINQLRSRGHDKLTAIVEAGKARLRPIMMTTLTTVLGLLPLALGMGAGTEIRAPMAWTVIAGLLSSTLLTLIVIPTVYALIDRRKFDVDTEEVTPDDASA